MPSHARGPAWSFAGAGLMIGYYIGVWERLAAKDVPSSLFCAQRSRFIGVSAGAFIATAIASGTKQPDVASASLRIISRVREVAPLRGGECRPRTVPPLRRIPAPRRAGVLAPSWHGAGACPGCLRRCALSSRATGAVAMPPVLPPPTHLSHTRPTPHCPPAALGCDLLSIVRCVGLPVATNCKHLSLQPPVIVVQTTATTRGTHPLGLQPLVLSNPMSPPRANQPRISRLEL